MDSPAVQSTTRLVLDTRGVERCRAGQTAHIYLIGHRWVGCLFLAVQCIVCPGNKITPTPRVNQRHARLEASTCEGGGGG